MRVVGGIFREQCLAPGWDQIFGSAGRAACAIATVFNHQPTLSGSYAKAQSAALEATFFPYKVKLDIQWDTFNYVFAYTHPLARPVCYVEGKQHTQNIRNFRDEVILLFGTIGTTAAVSAEKLIVDPQGEKLSYFLNNTSINGKEIAIVANEKEIRDGKNFGLALAVRKIFAADQRVTTVVAKRGSLGALVFCRDTRAIGEVAAYKTGESIFKIGSGDVFSAIFAYSWAVKRDTPKRAADWASRAVAAYVASPYFNFKSSSLRSAERLKARRSSGIIYLAAPFFTLADFLLLAEARMALMDLGAKVFSPFHDVGTGKPTTIVESDLKGIRKSDCMLALLHNSDPGTLFEIGYARAKGIPVVIHCERPNDIDSTMLVGSGCTIEADFCTALYRAHWAALGAWR